MTGFRPILHPSSAFPLGGTRFAPAPAVARGLFCFVSCAMLLAPATRGAVPEPACLVEASFAGAPAQYLDAEGHPAGFDVELFRAVWRMAAPERSLFWRNPGAEPAGGRGDKCRILLGVSRDSADPGQWEFCVPYRYREFCIFKRQKSLTRSLLDLRRKKIVVVTGSPVIPYLENLGFGRQLIAEGSVEGAIAQLNLGRYEVAVLDRGETIYRLGSGGLSQLAILPDPIFRAEEGMAVARGETKLRDALDAGMRRVRDSGDYDRMVAAWFPSLEDSGGTASRKWSWAPGAVWWVLLPAALVLAGLAMNVVGLLRRTLDRLSQLHEQLVDEKSRLAAVRDESAKQRFVLNRLSTVSLVDQIKESSHSDD